MANCVGHLINRRDSTVLTEADLTYEMLLNGSINMSRKLAHDNMPLLITAGFCHVANFYMQEDSFRFRIIFKDDRLTIDDWTQRSQNYSYFYDDPVGKEVRRLVSW